jgi:hypothetical protein
MSVLQTLMQSPNNPVTDPHKVLEAHETEKKKKYLKACLQQTPRFSPFVVSVGDLLGKESRTLLKKLPSFFAEKWESHTLRNVAMSMLRKALSWLDPPISTDVASKSQQAK